MTDQKEFCANPECQFHEIVDEASNKRGRMEALPVRFGPHDTIPKRGRPRMIERRQYVAMIDGKEKLLWFCSICAAAIDTPRRRQMSVSFKETING